MARTRRTELTAIACLIAASCLPLLLWVSLPDRQFAGARQWALFVGSVAGLMGAVLLLWQYVLGIHQVSALCFRDRTVPVSIHKFIGKYGMLMVFLHPLMMAYAYGEGWFYSLELGWSTEFQGQVSWGRLALYMLALIWVTSALFRSRLSFRLWRYIHYGTFAVLPLVFLHAPPIGTTFKDSSVALFWWYILVVIFLAATAVRLARLFGFGVSQYEVVDKIPLAATAAQLVLRPRNAALCTPLPGQYVYVQHRLFHEAHPFTVTDYSPTDHVIRITFKAYGPFTKSLSRIVIGDTVFLEGPYGIFTRELATSPPSRPVVFIVGGIGITPFIRHAHNPDLSATLLYCNQSPETALFRDELRDRYGVQYVDIFSAGSLSPSDVPNTEYGHINAAIIQKYVPNPAGAQYYLCGPKPMMYAARTALHSLGVPNTHISFEDFSF